MRITISFLFSITIIAITSLPVLAQKDTAFLAKAAISYNAKAEALPIEKVYLHLDKPNYLPGDTLWFKAYVVTGKAGQPSDISGVLYTELVNSADSVVSRVISEINSGNTWGDLSLSTSVKRGNYHLRAYTNWMRNAGAEYFYDQSLNIGGSLTLETTNQTAEVDPDVQFMPEGGELVNGLRSKVAFKVVKPNGLSENVTGSIVDNNNIAVAEFETKHAGMGIFPLLPQAGKIYTAKIKLSGGRLLSVALPKAKDAGYIMQINNSLQDSLVVKISANSQLFQARQNSAFYLIAQSGGVIYYTTSGKLNEPTFTASVIKNRFPCGIVQFTLFDDSGQPISERIVFIANDDTLKMRASSIVKIAHPRDHNSLTFTITNAEGAAVAGTFSMAVINQSRVGVDEDAEGSIYSHLLLKSDLKGYIEKPNYYFNRQTPNKLAELDILMLTQGYRKFEWRALNNPPAKPAYDAEQYLSLEGSVKTLSGAPVPNSKVSLTSTREGFFADTIANAAGNFKFDKLSLTDTAKIALQARKEKGGKNVFILVKLPNYPVVLKEKVTTAQIDFNNTDPLFKTSVYKEQLKADSIKYRSTLPQITVTAKRIAKPDRFNMNGVLPERLIDVSRIKLQNSLQEAARWAIPGIFSQDGTLTYEGRSLAVSVNGLRMTVSDLAAYDPAEIDNIRLISGSYTTSPLLLFTTKSSVGTDTTVLKEVVVKAKRSKSQLLTRSSNLHGAGNADQVLMGDKLVGCVNIADCLRGKLFGVTFKADGTPVNTSRGVNRDMVIIVDGVQLPGSELNNVVADNVLSIETLITAGSRSIYGASVEGGALIITNKIGSEGKFVTSEIAKGIITYPFKGFHVARKYYAPKYAAGQNTGTPNLRSGIYWKPDITTDSEGKFSVDYFNGDTKGTYRIVLEGLDDNGKLGRQTYYYSVK
ncbi:hypothetical protein [Mucilaginibacter glaciei]|uniref:TonB-dependent SusC/RagA subfamily outer membrane receptor n=1 Tax=Mucilaginibacter glaciei TaxID=2772109 RepID=A0A926NP61_9SPHI|nr:hypothetical protein [Mucilaginibacter glaciei]MBD1392122.1 hypothetical protein [Mucilaginibacter glaciei]